MNDIQLETDYIQKEWYQIKDDDPLSATLNIHTSIAIGRGEWQTRTETKSSMKANKTHYLLEASVTAYEGETLVSSRQWQERIARDKVLTPQLSQLRPFFQPIQRDGDTIGVMTTVALPDETITSYDGLKTL